MAPAGLTLLALTPATGQRKPDSGPQAWESWAEGQETSVVFPTPSKEAFGASLARVDWQRGLRLGSSWLQLSFPEKLEFDRNLLEPARDFQPREES